MFSRTSYSTILGLLLSTAFATAQAPSQLPATPPDNSTQPPEVTFKVEVNYVEEDVRVVDSQGHFVRGLKRDDFQVSEGGKPQKVTTFGLVDLPADPVRKPLFAAPNALPIESDVATNEQNLNGRLYLLLLDDYHVDPSRTQVVKALARRFILEKLGANDQAAVIVTSGTPAACQEFTQNRRLLLDAVDRFMGQKIRSATLGKYDALDRQPSPTAATDTSATQTDPNANVLVQDPEAQERIFKARGAMNSVRSITEWMSAIQGRRKAIVFVSEGVDYQLYDIAAGINPAPFDTQQFSTLQYDIWDTINAASRSNVQIYAVDPRGLNNMSQEGIELNSLPEATMLGSQTLLQELTTSQWNLQQLAEETGGIAFVGTNDLTGAFDRIVEENSSYYVLGYYPANDKRDGKLRNISVKVAGHPDALITFRKRYVAPRGDEKPRRPARNASAAASVTSELMQTIANPLPKTGLPLRVTAVPHKGIGATTNLEILVETSGKELTFKQDGGTFNNVLSLQIGVFNKDGKPVAGEQPDVQLRLKPETHALVASSGIRVLRHLSMPAGRYQLRVAAQDSAKTKQGSAHLDIDVPDFTKGSLTVSGIALATATADPTVAASAANPFWGGLPTTPTTRREFPSGDVLAAFVEVYDNQPTPLHRLDITTTVKADDGRAVFSNSQERSTEELHGTPGAFGYSVQIPLTAWPEGLYVLAIQAKSRVGTSEPVARTIQFRIRGR